MPAKTRRAAPIALLLPAAVGACSLGPHYKRPETAVPREWNTAAPSAREAWPSAEWWRGFRSPRLDALIAEAHSRNTDLGAAAARVRQADAQARIAGAPLLPSVGANVGAAPTRLLNNLGRERHFTRFQGILQASYEIDFWGKNRAALEAAEASASASRYDWQVVSLTITAGVAASYFQALGLQDELRVARDNVTRAQRDLDGMAQQQAQGIVPLLAVVQQQVVVDRLAAAIPPLEQQLAATRDALAILVGKLPEELDLPAGSLVDLSLPAVAPGLPSELLLRRPDVQQAEAQLVSANANIRVARAQFFPSFNLNPSGGVASMLLAHGGVPVLGVYSFAASIVQPIFEGGRLRGQLELSEARYQELLEDYRKAALSAFGDVEDALAAIRATANQQAVQEKAVASARRAYQMSLDAFHGGTETILSVLVSESALYMAENARVQARLARIQALVSLFKALGGGWKT
ncbi:MAG TPA: efflux transporter outer membrane subunit [Crenalkalicoccus sp.]|nr:efflux transporter outer membrane subunit [Crenalkalicoccus sp.]